MRKAVSGTIDVSGISATGIKFEPRSLRNTLLLVACREGAVLVLLQLKLINRTYFGTHCVLAPSAKYKLE